MKHLVVMKPALLTLLSILIFQTLALSQEQTLIPYRKGKLWGLANENKEIVLKPRFEEIGFLSEGLAAAKKKGKWGYINAKGIVKIPFIYDYAEDFSEGQAIVERANDTYYINSSEKRYDTEIRIDEPILPYLPPKIYHTIDSLERIYAAEYVYLINTQDSSLFEIKKK